jgi:DNA-binding transcriptional LysR family regulator
MNIHHLELFYYVATHEGINGAVRNMPYGIQQPAVSAQILQLESYLGVSLFQRRPFCLTPAGDKLYRFIHPFFQNLDNVADEIRGGATEMIRIGASDVVLKQYLPDLIQRLRVKFPATKLTLRAGYQPELVELLRQQEIDMALTLIDKNLPGPMQTLSLIRLPLVLLMSKKVKIKSASELWRQKRLNEPLLCLPENEVICKHFQEGLRSRGVDWRPSIRLSSLELIDTYVESGYGFGLSVNVPGKSFPRSIRPLFLDDFPLVEFGAIWQGNLSPLMQTLLQEVQCRAQEVSEEIKVQKSSLRPESGPRLRAAAEARP